MFPIAWFRAITSPTRPTRPAPQNGITLIELMIVLIIIGILGSFATAQYSRYMQQSRRADAMSSLTMMMAQQELYYGNHGGNYASTVTNLGYTSIRKAEKVLAKSRDGYYEIEMLNCADPPAAITDADECIQLRAYPPTTSPQYKDHECGCIVLDSYGRRKSYVRACDSESKNDEPGICWR